MRCERRRESRTPILGPTPVRRLTWPSSRKGKISRPSTKSKGCRVPDAIQVPVVAVFQEQGEHCCYVDTSRGQPVKRKVSIGVTEGWMGEDMFFYAGPGALGRAQLAETILRERFALVGLDAEDLRLSACLRRQAPVRLAPADLGRPRDRASRRHVGQRLDRAGIRSRRREFQTQN